METNKNQNMLTKYTQQEALNASIEYFKGDVMAAEVWVKKYALKDTSGNVYELTPDDMHKRIAREFARIEQKYKNPMTEDEIFDLIKNFKYIVPQGSPMAGIGNNFQTVSLSNCFVIGHDYDSYGSILRVDEEQTHLMKRRGGVGHDLSHIRPKGSVVNNSALTSTGIVPFMERYSQTTREVAQEGRRGALMLSISIEHPDAEDFIDAKMQEGKITGANVSVKLTNEFMEAALNNKPFVQKYPIGSKNPIFSKEIDANALWKKIVYNAWKSAEPGVLFWDNLISESIPDCYGEHGFKTVSTNPCFEGSQLLLTEDGYKTFKDLAELTRQHKCPKLINKKGEAVYGSVWSSGIKSVVQLTLDFDNEIICTPNHKIALFEFIPLDTSSNSVEAIDSLGYKVQSFSKVNKNGDNSSMVTGIKILKDSVEVFDFNLQDDCHWGVVNDIVVHNCGEIPLCPADACRLLSINLYSYVEHPFAENAKFNMDLFKQHVIKAQRMMDDIVDLEIEKIDAILKKINIDPEPESLKQIERDLWERIKHKTQIGRRCGLGITAEGDMLAALGLIYGSDEAIKFAENLHKTLKLEAYRSSVIMGRERGVFSIWDANVEKDNPFINRIKEEDESLYEEMMKHGRRNIALLTIAPTGSVSILTQTTSGIEPVFLPNYTRRRKINPQEKNVKIDFTDKQGDSWQEYQVFHHKFETWLVANGYNVNDVKQMSVDDVSEVVKKSPYYKATSADVDWVKKIEMQGKIQKHVDHSISVTVNLPSDATEEIVSKVYETGWRVGCKGLTVYRDGCRSGVLVVKKEDVQKKTYENNAVKRPKAVNADVFTFQNNYEKWIAIVGKVVPFDGADEIPYELFTGKLEAFPIPSYVERGQIIKRKIKNGDGKDVSIYDFKYIDKDGYSVEMSGLSRSFNEEYWNYAKLISAILRHGMPMPYILNLVASLKLRGDSLNTWKNGVERTLRKYVKDGTESSDLCEVCGAKLIYVEGCLKCNSCGQFSKCG